METESEPWKCEYCTFINEPTWLACGMCCKECNSTDINGFLFDNTVTGDVLDGLVLDAASEFTVQPAVATVSAAASATAATVTRTPCLTAAPITTGVTAVDTNFNYLTAGNTAQKVYSTAANTYVPHTTVSPVKSIHTFKNVVPSVLDRVTEVKYTPYRVGPVTTAAAVVNADNITTSLVETASPVTTTATCNGAVRVTTAAFAAAYTTDTSPGWMCSFCTFINDKLLLRCACCDTRKPENKPATSPIPPALESLPATNNPKSGNDVYFECPHCYLVFAQSGGIALKNCGHIFCKNCLRDVISYSAEPQLKCPFKIKGAICNIVLSDEEVCSILNLENVAVDSSVVATTQPAQLNNVSGVNQANIVAEPFQTNVVAGSSQANIGADSSQVNVVADLSQTNIVADPSRTNIVAGPSHVNKASDVPKLNAISGPPLSVNFDIIDLCSDEDEGAEDNVENCPPVIVRNEINYQELLELEKEVLISNLEDFECTVCMTEQGPGEGIVIRDCLHMFCRECLKQAIKCNTDAEMRCPFGDGTTRCESTLQDREIKALVDQDVYEKHLRRSITEAENKIQNTFHCKTVDCIGWCEYDEKVAEFMCPVCSKTNCINCKAIHTGLDCKQYQIKVQLNSAENPEDAKTNKMLQTMLEKGTAMHCPKCGIILSKVTGCDWLCCSMCKTEICWVTRGPRWGPKGRGDDTGGCRCRLNGKICHPKCGNCH